MRELQGLSCALQLASAILPALSMQMRDAHDRSFAECTSAATLCYMPVSLEVVMSKAMLSLVLPDSLKYVQRKDDTSLQILLMLYFRFTIRTLLHRFYHPSGEDTELSLRGPQAKKMIRYH